MSQYEKTKKRILNTPTTSDITPIELQNFLKKAGFELKRVNGSHFIYKHSALNKIQVIPMHNPIKQVYIDKIREYLIEIEGE